MFNYPAISVQK